MTEPEDDWLDGVSESKRASASEPDTITRMLESEVRRLFPLDEVRIVTNPDGSKYQEDAPFEPDHLVALDPIFVESRNEGDDDFDHVVVAFRDREAGDIPLIVTCL